MKFLTIVRPGAMPPPPDAVRAAQDWIHEKLEDGTFECVYSFLAEGGFSVGEAESLEDQMELMGDYPMAAFVQFEVHPLVGIDEGFGQIQKMLDRAAAQMPQAG